MGLETTAREDHGRATAAARQQLKQQQTLQLIQAQARTIEETRELHRDFEKQNNKLIDRNNLLDWNR